MRGPSAVTRAQRVLGPAIAISLGLTGGVLVGARRMEGVRAELRAARASAEDVAAQAQTLRAERNRLRAERNQLEARLASDRAPAVCPQAYVSTADSNLSPFFAVDYPCGWHVVRDARPTDPARPGIVVEITFFSRLAIPLAPRSAPIADVELTDWTDDPAVDGDELPALDRWRADERARFAAAPRETSFEGGAGISVHQLEGAQSVAGEDVAVVVLLWEFEDPLSGARHVVRAYAVAPGAKAREALDRMARTFSVPRR